MVLRDDGFGGNNKTFNIFQYRQKNSGACTRVLSYFHWTVKEERAMLKA